MGIVLIPWIPYTSTYALTIDASGPVSTFNARYESMRQAFARAIARASHVQSYLPERMPLEYEGPYLKGELSGDPSGYRAFIATQKSCFDAGGQGCTKSLVVRASRIQWALGPVRPVPDAEVALAIECNGGRLRFIEGFSIAPGLKAFEDTEDIQDGEFFQTFVALPFAEADISVCGPAESSVAAARYRAQLLTQSAYNVVKRSGSRFGGWIQVGQGYCGFRHGNDLIDVVGTDMVGVTTWCLAVARDFPPSGVQ